MNSCPSCKGPLHTAGKLWCGDIKSDDFIDGMMGCGTELSKESVQLVGAVRAESNIPLYYSIPALTKNLSIGSVSPSAVAQCLSGRGKSVSGTHFERSSLRTDATLKEVIGCIKKERKRMDRKGRKARPS